MRMRSLFDSKHNSAEILFINQFLQYPIESRILKIKELILDNQIDFILKMAILHPEIAQASRSQKLSKHWADLWATLGVLITQNPQIILHDQPGVNKFDLFAGIYFYKEALMGGKTLTLSLSALQLASLKKAMFFHSIHAQQAYNAHQYARIASGDVPVEEMIAIMKTIIAMCKLLVKDYGSYAFWMTAEACIMYTQVMKKQGNIDEFVLAKTCAQKALYSAQAILNESKKAIFNASLGETLTHILELEHQDVNKLIQQIEPYFNQDEPKNLEEKEDNQSDNFCVI